MDILAARSFRVLLAVTLAANCCLPCYTLAYADELQEVADALEEEQEEIAGDAGGLEFSPGGIESNADAADGGAATEGHGTDNGAAAGAGEDSPSVDEIGVIELSPDDISNLGLSSSPLYSTRAASPGTATVTVWSDILSSIKSVVGGTWGSTADAVAQFWGWFSGSTNEKVAKAISASSLGIYGVVSQIQYWLQALRSLNLDMRNYQTTYLPMIETMRNLMQSQWGYGYGGTAIIQKSSPAWYLQLAANRLNYNGSLTGGDPDDYSAARLLARIHNSQYGSITYTETGNTGIRSTVGVLGYVANLLYQNNLYNESATTRLHYVGGLVGEEGSGDYSAARLLARIHNGLYGSITYSETGNTGVRSAISVLGYIANLVYQGDQYLSSTATRLHYIGPLSGVDGEGDYSVARLLARIHNYDYSVSSVLDAITKGPEGGRVSLYNIGNAIETIKNETRDLDNLLESVHDRLSALDALGVRLANIGVSVGDVRDILGDQNTAVGEIRLYTSRHVLNVPDEYEVYTLWDLLYSQFSKLENLQQLLLGLQQTLTAWGNRWDLQDHYLMEWAKRWDALDKSPVDLSETNKFLGLLTADVASIRDKYVVGDTLSDMFGALVGDLQVPATAAAIDGIKGAMSTAFPFCIPSVVNLVLFGSVVADPQAPVWEFDIAGSPLVVDFAPYEALAEVCRWTVRLLFVAALLLNTRKFVYGMGGAY
ncbi:MAG: hypothetical protein UFX72_07655 [Adlercreutzia sp.]|nr:hypothetical protein [Adlercreutzia sp.]